MRRRLAALAAAAVVAVSGVLGASEAAQAAADPVVLQDVGWWSSRTAALPRGAGKLEVALDPSGAQSVAAIRFAKSGAAERAILVLNEEVGAVNATTSALRACVASDTWIPADGGPLAGAPAADCSKGQLDLTRDATFGRWTGDIASLLAASATATASVIVMPVSVKTLGLLDLGFVLPFSNAQLLVPAGGTPPSTAPISVPTSPTVAPPVLAPSPVLSPSFPSFSATPPTTIPVTTTAPAEVALPAPGVIVGSRNGDSKPWGRLVWMVPLSAVAGVAAATARRRLFTSSTGVGG